jgi:NADPH-dependent F420 reductase
MKIGIIGAGNVGGTLGKAWAAKGHDVTFGVRDPGDGKVRALVAETGGKGRAASVGEAAATAEVVVLATPWDATRDAIRAAGSLAGKIVVDATNPLRPDLSGLALGHTTSAGEEIARWAPGARVVKAFNTIGAQHMADPRFGGERASMFVCGDDAAAKRTVAELAAALGFDPVDCGPLTQARLLEPLAMLWISLAYAYGHGPGIGFRLLRR